MLILALIFLVFVGGITAALLTFTGNSLLNLDNVDSQQAIENGATGATDLAIQTVRYADSIVSNGAPTPCAPTAAWPFSLPASGAKFYVSCSVSPTSNGPFTRTVDFFTCNQSGTCDKTSSDLIVMATVEFVDGGSCSATAIAACGLEESVLSWTNTVS